MCPGLNEEVEISVIEWRYISIQKDPARYQRTYK